MASESKRGQSARSRRTTSTGNPTIKTSDNNRHINIHEEDQAREYGEAPY